MKKGSVVSAKNEFEKKNVQFCMIYFFFRLKDDSDTPMLLKLKDWPPSEDIANYMPRRFNDIINTYPLHEYTHR